MGYKLIPHDNNLWLPEIFMYLGFKQNDILDIELHNNCIMIRKAISDCFICGNITDLIKIKEKFICCECVERLRNSEPGNILY